jgi:hypothetical protein
VLNIRPYGRSMAGWFFRFSEAGLVNQQRQKQILPLRGRITTKNNEVQT